MHSLKGDNLAIISGSFYIFIVHVPFKRIGRFFLKWM